MIKYSTLKKFFKETELPKSIKLEEGTVILDVDKFVNSHFDVLDTNHGNKSFVPYFDRLVKLYKLLK